MYISCFCFCILEVKELLREACMYAFALTDAVDKHVISEDDVIIDALAKSCVGFFFQTICKFSFNVFNY